MPGCLIRDIIWRARLARDGDPEEIYFEETTHYRIEGDAFVYIDNDSGRTLTILGYPVRRTAECN